MNVSSLAPWLLGFYTVWFSGSSDLNLLLSFFWLCEVAKCKWALLIFKAGFSNLPMTLLTSKLLLTNFLWIKLTRFCCNHGTQTETRCTSYISLSFYLKISFIYFQREGKGGRRRRESSTCERNINWLPPAQPQPGAWPATQACALRGNQTSDLLVHRPALNPLSHTSQNLFLLLMWAQETCRFLYPTLSALNVGTKYPIFCL